MRFILSQEKGTELYFSALQGEYAREFLPKQGIVEINMQTFYLVQGDKVAQKSTAALLLIPYLKWHFKSCYVFWLVPRFIRDLVYGLISKNRYRFFNDRCDIGVVDSRRIL